MGESVTYVSRGDAGQGYLAVPDHGAPGTPAVIVLHEWWGTDPHTRAVADRFAAAGLTALVPDLYRGLRAAEPTPTNRVLMGLAMDSAAAEIGAAARFLADLADGGPVSVTGFRMGGSLALWSARAAEIAVAVAFYPTLPWEHMAARWDGYRGSRAVVHAADLALTGPGVELAGQAVEAAGGEWRRYDYPGAREGFFNDDRPGSYHLDAATLAWARTVEVLRATAAAPRSAAA
ncbi:MAG: dienelactone hydrolase family protein [Actinocatenispora sp.]